MQEMLDIIDLSDDMKRGPRDAFVKKCKEI